MNVWTYIAICVCFCPLTSRETFSVSQIHFSECTWTVSIELNAAEMASLQTIFITINNGNNGVSDRATGISNETIYINTKRDLKWCFTVYCWWCFTVYCWWCFTVYCWWCFTVYCWGGIAEVLCEFYRNIHNCNTLLREQNHFACN